MIIRQNIFSLITKKWQPQGFSNRCRGIFIVLLIVLSLGFTCPSFAVDELTKDDHNSKLLSDEEKSVLACDLRSKACNLEREWSTRVVEDYDLIVQYSMQARRLYLELGLDTKELDQLIKERQSFFDFLNDHRKFMNDQEDKYESFRYRYQLIEK